MRTRDKKRLSKTLVKCWLCLNAQKKYVGGLDTRKICNYTTAEFNGSLTLSKQSSQTP